jgi:hypothetical protein
MSIGMGFSISLGVLDCLRGKPSASLEGEEDTRKPSSLLFHQGRIVTRGVEFTGVVGWRDGGTGLRRFSRGDFFGVGCMFVRSLFGG